MQRDERIAKAFEEDEKKSDSGSDDSGNHDEVD